MGISAAYDNDIFTAYGFPLNWYTPSIISSGGYEIAVGRLFVDLGTYWASAYLMWIALRSHVRIAPKAARIFLVLLWVSALMSLFIGLVGFSIDPHLTWWELNPPTPQTAARSYFVSVGLQPQPASTHHQ
jgi:hypothetical protein